jgi:hypothetical protein
VLQRCMLVVAVLWSSWSFFELVIMIFWKGGSSMMMFILKCSTSCFMMMMTSLTLQACSFPSFHPPDASKCPGWETCTFSIEFLFYP